jgi:carboxypeptidase Taq
MGGLGYFPTYTLGNLYAAQLMEQARADLGDLDAGFRMGRFERLKGWLNDKVHKHGQKYRPRELAQKITGQTLSPRPLVQYLQRKYGTLYGL